MPMDGPFDIIIDIEELTGAYPMGIELLWAETPFNVSATEPR